MTKDQLKESARSILRLLDQYSRPPNREMLLDGMLFAYLEGRLGKMSRQFRVPVPGKPRSRVDFRRGTVAPALLEFAVRPPTGGVQLYGPTNHAELRKLTRMPQTRARWRYLLLLDLSPYPIDQRALQATYDRIPSDRGNFKRHCVRVVYVSRNRTYDFGWK